MNTGRLPLPALLLGGLALVACRSASTPRAERPAIADVETVRVAAGGGEVEARVTWPAAGAGKLPVIIWSHGLGSSKDTYAYLAEHWARAGYVVIRPTHPGSDSALFRGVQGDAQVIATLRRALTDPAILAARPRDIARTIDALPAIEAAVPGLAGRIDAARVGVGGHSFGAYTALASAGLVVDLPGAPAQRWADRRPAAFLAISPQGRTENHGAGAWSRIDRPVLVMSGSNDAQARFLSDDVRDAAWRMQAWEGLPATGNKWLVFIEGAYHHTFAAGAGSALFTGGVPIEAGDLDVVRVSTTAFWDHWLKGDAAGRGYVVGGGIVQAFGAARVRVDAK